MKTTKNIIGFFFLLFSLNTTYAQQTIRLEDAIKLALSNNYGIEIARNIQTENSIINNTANAGFYPQINLNASNQLSHYQLHQETDLQTLNFDNLQSNAINASLGLTWTIFDGTKMFITYKKLKELKNIGDLEFQLAVENLVYQVTIQYYTIIKIQQQITLSESLLLLYQKRKEVAESRKDIGNSSGLEVMQAQTDFNAQSGNILRLQNQLKQAKNNFAALIFSNVNTNFDVDNTIEVAPLSNFENIKSKINQQNTKIKIIKSEVNISNLILKESRTNYFPRIGFGLNYNFVNIDNYSPAIINQQTKGLYYGLTASWKLFNGLELNRTIKIAKNREKIMQLALNEINLQVETMLLNQYYQYENNLKILNLEEQNIIIAQAALNIAMEKYKIGVINNIQLKEAQKTYEDAQFRLIQSRFELKINEIELLKLQGLLIKN